MVDLHADATSAKKSHWLPEYRTCDLAYREHTYVSTYSVTSRGQEKCNANKVTGDRGLRQKCIVWRFAFLEISIYNNNYVFFSSRTCFENDRCRKVVKKIVVIFRFHNGRFNSWRRRARQKSNSSLKLPTERRRRYMCAPKKEGVV